ncbi:transcription-repair coupling factor [Candidatus Margulisiibacteriota bacterium]
MPEKAITISIDDYPKHNQLITDLTDFKYTRIPMVLEPGEFAVRGGIIDVYPINQNFPIRIEYFGDEIERINTFNVVNQRSISKLKKTTIAPVTAEAIHFDTLTDRQMNDEIMPDFEPGDFVVHEDYGVGMYQGLEHKSFGEREGEYIFIRYKGEDKLYVPLEQIDRLHPYSDKELKPHLNSLSDNSWHKTRTKTKQALEELAEDVYLVYKARQTIEGHAFAEDTLHQIDLEESFKHEDTADQIKVTAEIKKDMESAKPMDRVLCGDVGYGKTEIIVRAAFKAAENNKQTAVLVPTTILADQHFTTFSERFSDFEHKHKVEMLSRFKSKEEIENIKQNIAKNNIKVVIGTHMLLGKNIDFQDLGLLVIDEEQRFGVSHKEKIKKLKTNVDVISISATPIPRTLYMALTGAKDFSILKTPPVARKPIKTTVAIHSDQLIKQAIEQEIKSGGQVFYLFNNVERIKYIFQKLQKLVPEYSVVIAHGQMRERELENVVHDFINKKYDILLCTTIIESGVDIPNVNTIIMDNAHLLGLSQIHQIRGRVGRTQKQGYAYLMYPKHEILSDKAKKRLQAIREYAALGSGHKLALKDLEIRGAGTLLGKKQHGHMTAVGFELYCKLLEESVHRLKGEKAKVRKPDLIIDKHIKTFIPDFYISNERERLSIYRRLGTLMYKHQLKDLLYELEDRYGKIPKLIKPLFNTIRDQLLD